MPPYVMSSFRSRGALLSAPGQQLGPRQEILLVSSLAEDPATFRKIAKSLPILPAIKFDCQTCLSYRLLRIDQEGSNYCEITSNVPASEEA